MTTFARVILPALLIVIIELGVIPGYTGVDKDVLAFLVILAIAIAAQSIVTAINDAVTAMRAIIIKQERAS
jgi:hypothetical protein